MDGKRMQSTSSGARFLFLVAAFVIVIAGVKAASAIIIPFLLSAFIAVICAPAFFWLKSKKIPTVISLFIVITTIIIAGFLLTGLIGSSINDFSKSLPLFQSRIDTIFQGSYTWFNKLGIELSETEVSEIFDPAIAMRYVAKIISEFGNVLKNGFLILLTVIFILLESSSFNSKIHTAFGSKTNAQFKANKFLESLKKYMALKAIISLVTGIIIAIYLWLLGVKYPLLWGLLAFLFNFIPNLGSILAAIPAVLMALIQLGSGIALSVALGYVVVNIVIGNIVEPKFMGRGLGLSTLVVFLSLVFWGWVLGLVGMLLSVPLTMTLKIALENNDELRWIAILLGSEREHEPAT
ncbi:MAG: AI-2E family transporter [Thiohalomonadales bacterium]